MHSNYSKTGMLRSKQPPWASTLHCWMEEKLGGSREDPWWGRRGLGTAGMDQCQYFISLDALLCLSLKTSNIRLLRVCYFTILCCRDASVQKEKKWENRSLRPRVWCLVSAASEHTQFSFCLSPQQWFGVWKPPGASDDMMRGLCSLLISSSSHRPNSLVVSQCRPGNRNWGYELNTCYVLTSCKDWGFRKEKGNGAAIFIKSTFYMAEENW